MYGNNRNKLSLSFVSKIIIFLLAIMFENRRSEIVALIISFLVLYIMSLDPKRAIDFIKKIGGLLVVVTLLFGSLILLLQAGYLPRYEEVVQKILLRESYNQDVTGGRFALWGNAWSLFKAHPVLGIGWEQFLNNNRYHHDVHNTYLQWLCETGLIGFVMIFIPTLRLFFLSFRKTLLVIRKRRASSEVTTIAVVGFGMQLFFLIINIVDPAFYHLNYFCFFAIAVMLSDSASVFLGREEGIG